jgi:hypothetical protein
MTLNEDLLRMLDQYSHLSDIIYRTNRARGRVKEIKVLTTSSTNVSITFDEQA